MTKDTPRQGVGNSANNRRASSARGVGQGSGLVSIIYLDQGFYTSLVAGELGSLFN